MVRAFVAGGRGPGAAAGVWKAPQPRPVVNLHFPKRERMSPCTGPPDGLVTNPGLAASETMSPCILVARKLLLKGNQRAVRAGAGFSHRDISGQEHIPRGQALAWRLVVSQPRDGGGAFAWGRRFQGDQNCRPELSSGCAGSLSGRPL